MHLAPSTLSAPLSARTAAPDFDLAERDGRRVRLSDLRGQPVILAFYPDDWDPSRADQLAHFNWLVSQVPGIDAELLGISRDGMWCDLAFADRAVRVPVLADLDPSGAVAASYGVQGGQAMFVVDGEGVIVWSHTGPAGTSPRADELVRALGSLVPRPDAAAAAIVARDWRADPNLDKAPCERDYVGASESALMPTRREFVATALAAAFALTLTPITSRAEPLVDRLSGPLPPDAPAAPVSLRINGRTVALDMEPRVTLLDALREYAGLTGTKKGCDHGQCGACTVHVNGRRQLSCLTFAVMHQGDEITTVEGLAKGDTLHPMQTAFIERDGFQCGYCTSGQLMSATALLEEPCGKADADVRECMSGNLCRCGAYEGIVAAIQDVRRRA
jgi:xanthine dehydrogenase YagT iron-sulfur-binding subunit